jgi:hypothetical protein
MKTNSDLNEKFYETIFFGFLLVVDVCSSLLSPLINDIASNQLKGEIK